MGLTERHWFENEDTPENYEWALENAVYNSHTNKKVDMVEVVRCKNCKWWKDYKCENDFVLRQIYDCGCYPDFHTDSNWFCAEGERR